MDDRCSRRMFMSQAAAIPLAQSATGLLANLTLMESAAAATASDYKALVCVFLNGGNDYANTLVPYDAGQYAAYRAQRPALAYAQTVLEPTVLDPLQPLPNGAQYALAPELQKLLPIFNAGKMGILLNVGTLIRPTTKAQVLAKSVELPPKLFSHNDQQSYWQSGGAEGAPSGWGGRIGDLMLAGNNASPLTCISIAGNAVFATGRTAVQYAIPSTGPIALNARNTLSGSTSAAELLKSLIAGNVSSNHKMQEALAAVGKRSLSLYDQITSALGAAPVLSTPFPTPADPQSSLGPQLQMVARLISMNKELGVKRQVYFVSTGRFDTHSALSALHPTLLTNLADALRAFYDATVELGVSDQVTTFTASDFGRALTANNGGSDHGWGGVQFVLGGAVNGKRFYGINPVFANGGPDDLGQGRLVPTMSVNQYAATLATWFGVPATDLPQVLPQIANFAGSPLGINIGFMR